MRNWKSCRVTADNSMIEVLQAIDKSALKIALVTDDDEHLLGIISDGDIRRAQLAFGKRDLAAADP